MTIDKRKFIRSTSDIVNSFNPFHCPATKTAPKPSPFFDKSAPNPRCQSIISSNRKSLELPFPFTFSLSIRLPRFDGAIMENKLPSLYRHRKLLPSMAWNRWAQPLGAEHVQTYSSPGTAVSSRRCVCVCAPEAHRHKASAYQFATTS